MAEHCRPSRAAATLSVHGRAVTADFSAAHTPSVDGSLQWLAGEEAADRVKIPALLQLIMYAADVGLEHPRIYT